MFSGMFFSKDSDADDVSYILNPHNNDVVLFRKRLLFVIPGTTAEFAKVITFMAIKDPTGIMENLKDGLMDYLDNEFAKSQCVANIFTGTPNGSTKDCLDNRMLSCLISHFELQDDKYESCDFVVSLGSRYKYFVGKPNLNHGQIFSTNRSLVIGRNDDSKIMSDMKLFHFQMSFVKESISKDLIISQYEKVMKYNANHINDKTQETLRLDSYEKEFHNRAFPNEILIRRIFDSDSEDANLGQQWIFNNL